MTTPERFQQSIDIWREDKWARRTAYLSFTLAFAALGATALENIGLGIGLGAAAAWMGNNAINYFN